MAPKRERREREKGPEKVLEKAQDRAVKERGASENSFVAVANHLYTDYVKTADTRTKLIDTYLVTLVALGALQFVFCVVFGTFPFNAFLAGFGATVGQFVLVAGLRVQSASHNQKQFPAVGRRRAFGDFVFGSLVLHFIVLHFIN